jgi:lysophospholipase L1-like esterase
MLKIKIKNSVLLCLSLLNYALLGQSIVPFVPDAKNKIGNDVYMASFYNKLYSLRDSQARLNILHIGDSHLQADFLTQRIRNLILSNTARGLVVPCKVAKTNESYMYKTATYSNWQARRAVKQDSTLPIGIGGITIRTTDDTASIKLQTKDGKGFNYLKIFHLKDETTYNLDVLDENGIALILQPSNEQTGYFESTYYTPEKVHSVTIRNKKTNDRQQQSLIYGLYIANNENGIIYNSLGVNGAEYRHYGEAQYFAEQSKALNPDLIIVSLGTNEAANVKFDEVVFYNQIDLLVTQLKKYNPNAIVLLTSPADNYRRKKRVNTIINRVSKTIIKYSEENNMPYWDLYKISGGYKSAKYWKKYKLFAKDNLHYSRQGYEVQGTLLYNALFKIGN